MNIYQKINKVRQELLAQTFKADTQGYNYKYMDLPQIESAVTKACGKYGILPIVNFMDGYGSIEIVDMESDASGGLPVSVKIAVPVDPTMVRINDKQPIQNIGGMMTYMRRYLYMTAFSISEHDAVEDEVALQKAKEEGEEIGKKAAEKLKQKFTPEELKERTDMIDFLVQISPDAVEKLMAVKKVSSVDDLDTAYIRKVYNAKKEVKA